MSLPAGGTTSPLRRALERVRAAVKAALLARAALAIIAAVVGLTLAAVLLDYAFRLPGVLRLALLAGLAGTAWAMARRRLLPAMRLRPSLTDVALRLERRGVLPAGLPPMRDLLASGLEFGEEGAGSGHAALRREVAERAAAMLRREHWRSAVRAGPVLRVGGAALLAVLVAGVMAAARPTHAAIGLTRLVLPFGADRWPARTDVESAMAPGVRPADEAVELRATLVRSHRDPARTRVEAVYHVESTDGRRTRERRELLTPQSVRGAGEVGFAFTTILDPAMLLPPDGGADAREEDRWLVVRFETEDDRTAEQRVLLSPPPRVVGASVSLTPPAYVPGERGVRGASAPVSEDARVTVGPVLSGTDVEVVLTFNKPVFAAGEGEGAADTEGVTARLRLRADAPVTRPLALRDASGLSPRDEPTVVIGVVADRAPTAAVLTPRTDEDVLPTARVEVEAEARDDIAVSGFALERRTVRAAGAEEGGGGAGEPATTPGEGPAARERVLKTGLSLAELGVAPGDEVRLAALARDDFVTAEGPRPQTRSAERTLRIISAERLVEQIRGRLAAVEQAARDLDRRQGDLSRALREGGERAEVARSQRGVAGQIDQQRRALDGLVERVEQNGLEDEALRALLDDARALAGEAAANAEGAAERLEADDAASPRAAEQASRRQDRARDALGRLLERLSAGEDSFLARRGLERLLEQQRALAEQTASAGRETVGLRPEDLDAAAASRLAELAERQRELAESAQRAIDGLTQQAAAVRPTDPTEAGALERAASEARQRDVSGSQARAAGQIGQNQTGEAGREQAAAIEALEEILEQLDDAEDNRDAALRRELASLIDTLRGLVARQGAELERLSAERGGGEAGEPPLDAAMIALHARTLEAADRAGSGFAELAGLSGMIADAAVNQDDAITLLRAGPENHEAAEMAERDALSLLEQALAEAERVDEQAAQREQDRLRRELRQRYAAVLERHLEVAALSKPLVEPLRRLSRQERGEARRIARDQEAVRAEAAAVLEGTAELAESPMIALVHAELDRALSGAAGDLGGGEPTAATALLQARGADLLRTLVEAFTPYEPPRDDRFGEEGGGGGGGGQGGQQDEGLVQALTELRVMRGLQAQVLGLTRALDDAGVDRLGPYDRESLAELQRGLAEQGRRVVERLAGGGQGGAEPPTDDGGSPEEF